MVLQDGARPADTQIDESEQAAEDLECQIQSGRSARCLCSAMACQNIVGVDGNSASCKEAQNGC